MSETKINASQTTITAEDIGAAPVYDTMPTAAVGYLDKIVQYVGATDSTYTNGYFYKCVSDGDPTPTYSWSAINVQAGGGGSSYTAGTGIDITSGVISVTSPTLTNTATGTDSLTILGTVATTAESTNVGISSEATNRGTAFGSWAKATGQYAVALGRSANSSGSSSIAVAGKATANNAICIGGQATATGAIQIGNHIQSGSTTPKNSDANTLKVANANGNFEIMSADGTIPTDRLASTTGLADGNYRLRLTMSNGTPTLSWVAE